MYSALNSRTDMRQAETLSVKLTNLHVSIRKPSSERKPAVTHRVCTQKIGLVSAILAIFLLGCNASGWAKTCGANNVAETLNPYGDLTSNYMTDLVVEGPCNINGTPDSLNRLLYVFRNVNIVGNGALIFHDDYDIDFYAESVLIENNGKLIAVSTQDRLLTQVTPGTNSVPFQKRLTFHLWGAPGDPGIACQSAVVDGAPCGIPSALWAKNPAMAVNMMMDNPPPPTLPKNQPCVSVKGYSNLLPGDDCFYQYEIQDKQDKGSSNPAYFGHKVLALSFGGTLQLFGAEGVSYLAQGQPCTPSVPNTECNPAFTGTSWVRLTGVTKDANGAQTTITVNRAVHWKKGDHIVVTTTDYLPGHSEEVVLSDDADGTTIKLDSPGLMQKHNAGTYSLSALPAGIGPANDPNVPDVKAAVDTRAAVALLTRNIQIVSEGDMPSEPFTETPGNFYGGHTIVRQGFAGYQVQGVEFYQLGQGGAKGRYPVHFHMARKTPQPESTKQDPTPEPLNYLKDCSIHDSMTRWVTVHATEGMYIARNVGYKSIGHGFYLEDATEINNKFYSNIGVLARAAILDPVHNPRQVPGILADNEPVPPPPNDAIHPNDYMPYRSDFNHPTIFWIMNGWNDFQYNMAVGAATCGACYWWLPASDSGPSQYETWDGYASQQIDVNANTNYTRAGITPLKSFVGNSCVAAMNSFQMNGQTAACLGVNPATDEPLSAVPSNSPPGPDARHLNLQPFNVYYPVLGELHNPTICNTQNCSANINPCDGADTFGTCAVTQLDHYTTSFNFAQTNFSAVWLRKGWDLFSNGAVTDVQTGGLNFITGGGYTRSDVNQGEWLLARNTVFIGHTQPFTANMVPDNAFAADVGPFNKYSGLECDNSTPDHCAYAHGGVSFNLNPFPGQKLFNIYDGPAHQQYNAYLDINTAKLDCTPQGNCSTDPVPYGRNYGVLQDKDSTYCYLPNAAIGWKQPNGFYYPPAFHSNNLYFSNVDIRHFVIEPLFLPITPEEYDPFQQNQVAVNKRYCTHSTDMFSANFNNIDRQTVLNDDDGTLTGLVASEAGVKRPTISINEDAYFDAPLATPECLSDINVLPNQPVSPPFTASTSPYEWVTTAIIADCAISQKVGDLQCFDTKDNYMHWGLACSNSGCRGVPLYREFLTDGEDKAGTRPQIRMMGQAIGQRSTLSLNEADYYIDTTQNCPSQGGCPKCIELNDDGKTCKTYDGTSNNPSIFLGGHTYYVYFVYATPHTKQSYDIYVGKGSSLSELNVTGIQVDPNSYTIKSPPNGSFVTATYPDGSSVLKVSMDLTGQQSAFTASKPKFCKPTNYCSAQSDGSCGCKSGSGCVKDSDCSWGPSDIDCPIDPQNPNGMLCFGFSFKMPANFVAPDKPLVPDPKLFSLFTSHPYFAKGNVIFEQGVSISPKDSCIYNPVPTQ